MSVLRYPTSSNFVQKTLQAQLLQGVTSAATLNNVTSVQNKPGVMIVDRIAPDGITFTPTKREVIPFVGTSGSTVITLTRNGDGSGSDQDHAVGAIVEFGPDILWAQSVIDGLSQVIDPTTGLVDITKVVDLTSTQSVAKKTITSGNINLGSDAMGDIYYRSSNASLSLSRLGLGNLNEALTATATLPAYRPIANRSPFITLSDTATNYLDFNQGHKWITTIVPNGSARTYLATNATLGYIGMLRVKYASTASLALNLLTVGATISWYGGGTAPVATATVGKADLFGFVCTDTFPTFDGLVMGQNR